MRLILALALAADLFSCGSASDSKATPTPAPAPEVAKLNITEDCFATLGCTDTIGAVFSTGATFLGAPYSLVINIAEGDAPSACDAAGQGGYVIQIEKLKAATVYGYRACIFDGSKYSAGIAQAHTTGTP